MTVTCAICTAATFERVTTVSRSALVEVDGALEPRRRSFDIGRCLTCDHVQVTTAQTHQALLELYRTYIYKERRAAKAEPIRIAGHAADAVRRSAEPTPPHYLDILSFVQPAVLHTSAMIVDLGCGPGSILRHLRDAYEVPARRLVGIDFIAHLSPEHGIDLIVADLNELDEAATLACLPEPVGFVFCSHVLEHMIDPRRLLRFARKLLDPSGHFFIEVPDHTVTHPRNVPGDPGYIPLIVPEHLQYFSMRSLRILAESSGFEVVKSERVQSYDGYLPRLKLLLRPAPSSGVAAVVAYGIERSDGQWPAVGARVADTIEREPASALWGCGFGLLQMLAAEPRLEALIAAGRVALFDNTHFGKSCAGRPIRSEAALGEHAGTIILTPALPASRTAMRATATRMNIPPARIVDPYP